MATKIKYYIEIDSKANSNLEKHAKAVKRSRKAETERIIEAIFHPQSNGQADIEPTVGAMRETVSTTR